MATQVTLNSGSVDSAGSLALKTNGTTTAVTIDTSQNVGIGTASPARLLSLSAASPILRMTETGANSDLDFIVSTNSGGLNISVDANNEGANSFCAVSVDGSERMRIDSSGNVGVNCTANNFGANYRTVEARGASTTISGVFRASSSDASQKMDFFIENGVGILRTDSNHPLSFSTNSAERMRIDSSGNLLVGTTSSSVGGNNGITLQPNGNGAGKSFVTSGANSSSNTDITFAAFSTSLAQYQFYVGYGGTIYARSTSITSLSDQREKENIRPLETGLDQVMALQPRRFDWKNGSASNVAGFVAQEVEAVLPDLIDAYKISKEETRMGLKMGDMIPTLVKAIQELKALVDTQSSTITTLTDRITALEAK
jgi:hypothetical protein